MTSNTVNFNLPFPDGSDAPCDFSAQWCEFTQALDSVFGRFETSVNRTVPLIPLASMRVSAAVTLPAFSNIPYDTVVLDTAGWTAVDVNNTMISPDMAGVLSMSTSALFAPGVGAIAFLLDPSDSTGTLTEPNLPYSDQMDVNLSDVGIPLELAVMFSTGIWQPGLSGIQNNVGVSTLPTLVVKDATYTIYWHSDGGTL